MPEELSEDEWDARITTQLAGSGAASPRMPSVDCPSADELVLLAETEGNRSLSGTLRGTLTHALSCRWCRAELDALRVALAIPVTVPTVPATLLSHLSALSGLGPAGIVTALRERVVRLDGQSRTVVPAFSSASQPRSATFLHAAPGFGAARVTRDARGLLLHWETDLPELRDAVVILWLRPAGEDDSENPAELLGLTAVRGTGIGSWSAAVLPITPFDAERLISGTVSLGFTNAPAIQVDPTFVEVARDYADLGTRSDPLSRDVWKTWIARLPLGLDIDR